MALCWKRLSKKVHAWRVGRGLWGLGGEVRVGLGTWRHQELKSYNNLTERRNKNSGAAAAPCSLSPANPRKLYVLWQRLSMVLLHLLGWERELQFPLIPKSLELKTVPGVCHEEMTTCFCNAEGNQGLAIRWPVASELRAGASCQHRLGYMILDSGAFHFSSLPTLQCWFVFLGQLVSWP